MRKIQIFLSIIFFLLTTFSFANQIIWEHTYGCAEDDFCYAMQPTFDGGIILVGSTWTYPNGQKDLWLIKTDSEGNQVWNRSYGGTEDEEGFSVQQTTDGGFIVAGYTNSYGAGGRDAWLVKTDSEGNKEWDKTFGGWLPDQANSVQQTSDGGYIITGFTLNWGAMNSDLMLIKTDALGNQIWLRKYGGYDNDAGNFVQETSDGGFIITGYDSDNYLWLLKTDSEGLELWTKTFGYGDSNQGHYVKETSDGGFLVTGEYDAYSPGKGDFYLIKTDSNGNLEWDILFKCASKGSYFIENSDSYFIVGDALYPEYSKRDNDVFLLKVDKSGNVEDQWTFGGPEEDHGSSIFETSNGDFVIAGYTESYGSGGNDIWLFKTIKPIDKMWIKTFGSIENDYGYDVQQTTDSGFIITGSLVKDGSYTDDICLIKTDPNGNLVWERTFTSTDLSNRGTSVIQTSEGGYLIYGSLISSALIKTDLLGNEEWIKTFDKCYPSYHEGQPLQSTNDGDYIFTGNTRQFVDNNSDIVLIKTDKEGNLIWRQEYGGSKSEDSTTVKQTSDGGYILTGCTESYGSGKSDIFLMKTDAYGNWQWSQYFGSSSWDMGTDVIQNPDNSYVVTGYNYDIHDGYLIKTDPYGNIIWNRSYDLKYFCSLIQSSKGGFIITGNTYCGCGDGDALITETDSEGNILWEKIFGKSSSEHIYSTRKTLNNGFINIGYQYPSNSDIFLLYYNPNEEFPPYESPISPKQITIFLLLTLFAFALMFLLKKLKISSLKKKV